MFGRGQRDDLDDEEGAKMAGEMRRVLREEVEKMSGTSAKLWEGRVKLLFSADLGPIRFIQVTKVTGRYVTVHGWYSVLSTLINTTIIKDAGYHHFVAVRSVNQQH